MRALFLTSSINTYVKDKFGCKTPMKFENKNYILDNFKTYIDKYDNFLYIASDPNDYEKNDLYSSIVFKSFDLTLLFKNYYVLDKRVVNDDEKLDIYSKHNIIKYKVIKWLR